MSTASNDTLATRVRRATVDRITTLASICLAPLHRRRRRQLQTNPTIRRILILNQVKGLGNLVLLTPLLRNLRHIYPHARITVVMPSTPLAPAVLTASLVDELLYFEPTAPRASLFTFAWRELRPRQFDLGLCTFFSATVVASAALMLAGCRYRIGYARNAARGFLNTESIVEVAGHEVERHLRLLAYAGIALDARTTIPVDDREIAAAQLVLHDAGIDGSRPIVGMHPGSDRINAVKRWPLDRFVEVIRALSDRAEANMVVFLGPDDIDLRPTLSEAVGNVAHIVSDEDLPRVIALIACCAAFLTNDSGLMHVAAAVGVPVTAIFGPTSTVKNAPSSPATILVADDVVCRPCHVHSPIRCQYERRHCLENISVERVIAAVDGDLARCHADGRRRTAPRTEVA